MQALTFYNQKLYINLNFVAEMIVKTLRCDFSCKECFSSIFIGLSNNGLIVNLSHYWLVRRLNNS